METKLQRTQNLIMRQMMTGKEDPLNGEQESVPKKENQGKETEKYENFCLG